MPIAPEAVFGLGGWPVDEFYTAFYAGIENGHVIGYGGLGWRFGRCWLMLGGSGLRSVHAWRVVREARRMLRKAAQLGETEVFAWRDELPSSARLLRLLGFSLLGREEITFADGSAGEKEIWRWLIPSPG